MMEKRNEKPNLEILNYLQTISSTREFVGSSNICTVELWRNGAYRHRIPIQFDGEDDFRIQMQWILFQWSKGKLQLSRLRELRVSPDERSDRDVLMTDSVSVLPGSDLSKIHFGPNMVHLRIDNGKGKFVDCFDGDPDNEGRPYIEHLYGETNLKDSEWKAKYEDLQKRYNELEKERNEWKKKYEELVQTQDVLEKKFDDVKTQLEAELKKTAENLEKQKQMTDAGIQRLESEAKLKTQLTDLQKKLTEKENERTPDQEKIKSLENELKELKDTFDEYKEKTEVEMKTKVDRINKLDKEIETLKSANNDLTTKMKNIETDLENAQKEKKMTKDSNDSLQKEIDKLKEDLEQKRNEIDLNNSEIQTKKGEIEKLNSENEQLNALVNEKASELLGKEKDDFDKLKANIGILNSELGIATKNLDDKKKELRIFDSKYAAAKEDYLKLLADIASKENDKTQLEEEIKGAKKLKKDLETEQTKKTSQLEDLGTQINEKKGELAAMEKELTQKNEMKTELETKIIDKQNEYTEIDQEITTKKIGKEQLEKTIKNLREAIEKLENEFGTKNNRLQQLEAQIDKKTRKLADLALNLTNAQENSEKMTQLESQLAQTKKELENLKTELTSTKLKHEADWEEEHESVTKRNKYLEELNDELQKENKKLKVEKDHVLDANTKSQTEISGLEAKIKEKDEENTELRNALVDNDKLKNMIIDLQKVIDELHEILQLPVKTNPDFNENQFLEAVTNGYQMENFNDGVLMRLLSGERPKIPIKFKAKAMKILYMRSLNILKKQQDDGNALTNFVTDLYFEFGGENSDSVKIPDQVAYIQERIEDLNKCVNLSEQFHYKYKYTEDKMREATASNEWALHRKVEFLRILFDNISAKLNQPKPQSSGQSSLFDQKKLQTEIENLMIQKKALQENLSEKDKTIQAMKQTNQTNQTHIDKITGEKTKLVQEKKTLSKENDTLKETNSKMQKKYNEMIKEKDAAIQSLQSGKGKELGNLSVSLSKIQNDLSDLQNENASLKSQLEDSKADVEKLTKQLDLAYGMNDHLREINEKQIKDNEASQEKLRQQYQTSLKIAEQPHRERNKELEDQLGKAKARVEQLEEHLNNGNDKYYTMGGPFSQEPMFKPTQFPQDNYQFQQSPHGTNIPTEEEEGVETDFPEDEEELLLVPSYYAPPTTPDIKDFKLDGKYTTEQWETILEIIKQAATLKKRPPENKKTKRFEGVYNWMYARPVIVKNNYQKYKRFVMGADAKNAFKEDIFNLKIPPFQYSDDKNKIRTYMYLLALQLRFVGVMLNERDTYNIELKPEDSWTIYTDIIYPLWKSIGSIDNETQTTPSAIFEGYTSLEELARVTERFVEFLNEKTDPYSNEIKAGIAKLDVPRSRKRIKKFE